MSVELGAAVHRFFIGSLMHVVGLIAALVGAVGMLLRPQGGRVAEATP